MPLGAFGQRRGNREFMLFKWANTLFTNRLLLPESPILRWLGRQSQVFPGPGVSSAVPQPHVITTIGQKESQAVVGQVANPVTGRGNQAMLQIDNCLRSWKPDRTSSFSNSLRPLANPAFWLHTYARLRDEILCQESLGSSLLVTYGMSYFPHL